MYKLPAIRTITGWQTLVVADVLKVLAKGRITLLVVILAKEGVAKSKKALNHKDTKAQRKPFLSPGRSLSWPGKNFVSPCLCGSLLFRAFCDNLEGGCRKRP